MANNSHVNKYAKALFNTSIISNSSTNVKEGLNAIVKILKAIPEFNHLFFTKNTSAEHKKSILSSILEGKVDSLVIDLLIILIDNDQMQLFGKIRNKYNQLININSTELDVLITSNAEIFPEELNILKDELSSKSGKQINIKNNVDKSLLGGVQLRIGNTIIDNSLSNKLIKVKNNLKNNHANME